jgi:hypothetical protein
VRLASLVIVVFAASDATAEPDLRVAAAVNFPLMWQNTESVAGSLYVGLTDRDALRFNVASYRHHSSVVGDLLSIAVFDGDGDESSRSGRILDLGAAWTNYSRRLWSGFTWELGALVRIRDIRVTDDFATPEILATDTTTYAARGQLGWSWLIGNHVFVATAVGLSLGYERGTETADRTYDPMPVASSVSRATVSGEAFLRFGLAN